MVVERLISFTEKSEGRRMPNMSEARKVLEINEPHFTVRLFEEMLKIDLVGGVKNDLEEALENKPVLRQTLGSILGMFAPLHIRLSDIESVNMDKTGKVKMVLPRRRDVTIPLEQRNAKQLVDKLEKLIPRAKEREYRRMIRKSRIQKIAKQEIDMQRAPLISGAGTPTIPEPLGLMEREKEEEEKAIEEEESQQEEEEEEEEE
jgi:hypothetical protein